MNERTVELDRHEIAIIKAGGRVVTQLGDIEIEIQERKDTHGSTNV